jgi:thiamine kinase-like enzyme
VVRRVRDRSWRERGKRVDGLPPGIDFETLNALCREHGRGDLKRCEHEHLSGWKARGTYRLALHTEAGKWRLIFKDECYRPELIPALEGLPVSPGPPEMAVYRARSTALSPFLPQLFWSRELEPGRHFQYLLEDLAETHATSRPETLDDHVTATRVLLQLHKALREAFATKSLDGLLRYDRRYSERLLDYAEANLADYVSHTGDDTVAALSDQWRQVASVHEQDEFYDDGLRAPIHGDYNRSNIHFDPADDHKPKVVDWEWAGVGLPHADLAALAKSVRPEDHATLLQVFLEADRRLDTQQHWRLFHWCRLERRLLDTAFLARQQMASSRSVPWLQAEIRRSATDVLAAVARLRAAQAQTATGLLAGCAYSRHDPSNGGLRRRAR